jgi:hypothetical protein
MVGHKNGTTSKNEPIKTELWIYQIDIKSNNQSQQIELKTDLPWL